MVDLPRSCSQIKEENPQAASGEYTLQVQILASSTGIHARTTLLFPKVIDRFVHRRLHVLCEMDDDVIDGGWTLIQRRGQFGNPKDYFYRKWNDYFLGFGSLDKEFWMRPDNIQARFASLAPLSLVFIIYFAGTC